MSGWASEWMAEVDKAEDAMDRIKRGRKAKGEEYEGLRKVLGAEMVEPEGDREERKNEIGNSNRKSTASSSQHRGRMEEGNKHEDETRQGSRRMQRDTENNNESVARIRTGKTGMERLGKM